MKVVEFVLILPHSTATAERIFSQEKQRNRLDTTTMAGILHEKNLLKTQYCSCFDFRVPEGMLHYFNSLNMYVNEK